MSYRCLTVVLSCLEVVLKVSYSCLENVLFAFGKCYVFYRRLTGVLSRVSDRRLTDALSYRCLTDVLKPSVALVHDVKGLTGVLQMSC